VQRNRSAKWEGTFQRAREIEEFGGKYECAALAPALLK
jgi:hypothetical protein